ncbi:hypothetical protein ACNAW0_12845 [Micromonospora sp. SL1-18]|uniref:hypothetical protein n=1 Tax=Micromonospora sp. SL1-18 TaxID=3399128 RepID=UPI003A4D6E4C
MPEPQPGTDRPADGSTSATGQEPGTDGSTPATGREPGTDGSNPATGREPGTDGIDGSAQTPAPAPAETGTSGVPAEPVADAPALPAGDSDVPTRSTTSPDAPAEPVADAGEPTDEPVPDDPPGPGTAGATIAAPVPTRQGDSTTVPGRPSGSAPVPGQGGPDPTRVETSPQPPAPRWSGSAPVPPPPPRKRSWGESAEPTPVPPVDSPEHMVPVDPWEGVDTSGWDLHSADFPALPPTPPYPTPAHTPPYPPLQATPPPPGAGTPAAPAPFPPPPFAPAPPVAARPVSQPPVPVRPPRQRRQTTPPPPAPPGWQPPKGYVPVPVRRRRRWPWVLLLTVACCCGVPLWWAQPLRTQYPASATLPDQIAGLRLRQDERSQKETEELKTEVRRAHPLADDAFAGIYNTSEGKRVVLFGSTGLRLTPEADADAEITRLTDSYALGPAEPVETRVRGRYERCAVGRANGDAVVVCTSVDHGSLATGVFTRLNLDDSGHLLDRLRQQVVTPK